MAGAIPPLDLAPIRQAGNVLGGDGSLQMSLADAQGESLGANTVKAVAEAQARIQRNKALADNTMSSKVAALPGGSPALGDVIQLALQQHDGSTIEDIMKGISTNRDTGARQTIQTRPDTPAGDLAATDAAQSISPASLANPNVDAAGNLIVARTGLANGQTANLPSQRDLNEARAGYYQRSPGAGAGGANAAFPMSPALQAAISDGRLDMRNINSRNVRIYDQMAQNDPTLDFNTAHSGAVAQSNMTLQQRNQVMQALPQNIGSMVDLGTKLNYPDTRILGEGKQWLMGQNNDPDLAKYMGVRNDVLLNLASVMRGVGMSDQAHTAEIEANNPTLAPAALQAWAQGQLPIIQQRMAQTHTLMHPNIHSGGAAPGPAPAPGPGPAPAPAAGDPLGIR